MTQTPTNSASNANTASSLKPPSLGTMIRGLLPSIIVNGVLVFVIYQLVKHYTSASDVVALFLSAIPAMIGTIVTLIRQRSVDVLGAFALITIAVSIGLTFVTGDARLFQIRESFLTVLFGIVCLISLLFPKPIWYYIIRYFTTANNPQQAAAFDQAWSYQGFRTYIRNVTILWGITYVVEFVIRIVMVYNMPISQFLAISPFIFYGITIAVIYVTIQYGKFVRKKGEQRRQEQAMESGNG
jgi:intracellular septation protein A